MNSAISAEELADAGHNKASSDDAGSLPSVGSAPNAEGVFYHSGVTPKGRESQITPLFIR